jgi:arylsulfatase A-like enzyme
MEWPAKITQNTLIHELTSGLDLAATFRSIFLEEMVAGVDSPLIIEAEQDGVSLYPQMFNSPSTWKRPKVLAMCQPVSQTSPIFCAQVALLSSPWKIIVNRLDPTHMEFYNVDNDPTEEQNLLLQRGSSLPKAFNELRSQAYGWMSNITRIFSQNCPHLARQYLSRR